MKKSAIAAVLFCLTVFSAIADPEASPSLVGAWTYVREVDTSPDGSAAPIPSPPQASGSLIYTADGHVAVIVTPKSAAWSVDTVGLSELRAAVAGTTAYAGRYEVDAAAGTVTHVVEVSLEPDYVGKRLVRQFRVSGETLELSGTFVDQGVELRFTVYWRRDGARL